MGVNLRDIIKPIKISLNQLSGRTLAIDAYNAIYQFLAIIRGSRGEYLMDKEGRVTSHLSGLFYRNVNLLELSIKPIYVLDGKPSKLKSMEMKRRRVAKQRAIKLYNQALKEGDLPKARKFAQSTSYIKDYMLEDTKRILGLLGIPWVTAPSEGEATAAHLTKIGLASDAASQDFDALLFGAVRLLRNVTISGKRKLPGRSIFVSIEPEEFELKNVLEHLRITHEQLVDIGILIGTDFNPEGFKHIGPVTALKYVKKFGGLENINIIKEELKMIDYQSIRKIFLNPKVKEPKKMIWKPPDDGGITSFLCSERAFSEERVTRALKRLENVDLNRSESLEKWFF